jgi:hypothetical protein
MQTRTKFILGFFLGMAMLSMVTAHSELEEIAEKFLAARGSPAMPKGSYEDYDTYVLSIQWGSKKLIF